MFGAPPSPSAMNKISTTSGALPRQEEELRPRNYPCLKHKQNKRDLTKAEALLVRITSPREFLNLNFSWHLYAGFLFIFKALLQDRNVVQMFGCFALNVSQFSHFPAFLPGVSFSSSSLGLCLGAPHVHLLWMFHVKCRQTAPLGEGSRFWCFPLEEWSLLHLPGTSRLVLGHQRQPAASAQGAVSPTMILVPVTSPRAASAPEEAPARLVLSSPN